MLKLFLTETSQWKFYFKHNRKKQYLDICLQRTRVRFCTNAETSYSMKRYLAGYLSVVQDDKKSIISSYCENTQTWSNDIWLVEPTRDGNSTTSLLNIGKAPDGILKKFWALCIKNLWTYESITTGKWTHTEKKLSQREETWGAIV